MFMLFLIIMLVVSYLIGSIPTSYILGMRLCGVGLRKSGSGNPGATNAFRVLGWKIGVSVLLIDILKGFLPTLLVLKWKGGGGVMAPADMALLAGIAAIAGHMFTVFLRFKGGKGVATGVGVFLALAPKALLPTLAVCLLIIAVSRYVSLGSLIGSALLPVLIGVFYPERTLLIFITAAIGLMLIIRHRSNIGRLLRGKEHKLFS